MLWFSKIKTKNNKNTVIKEIYIGDGAVKMNSNHLLKNVKELFNDYTTNYKRADQKCEVKVLQRFDEISERKTKATWPNDKMTT